MHFHFLKTEDIINRGGGILTLRVFASTPDGDFSDENIVLQMDGVTYIRKAGSLVELSPGQSVTLSPGLYHEFWAKNSHGPVLIGEVSMTNDDNHDNRFFEPLDRFSVIEEDEKPYRLLCNEYPPA
jgi:D-lyxose ketol-isomerase